MRSRTGYKLIGIAVLAMLAFAGCEWLLPHEELPVITSTSGNLIVANASGEDLALFVDGKFVTGVPNGVTDLVVLVEVAGTQEEKVLRLYAARDVVELNEPDVNLVYRSWNVVLSSSRSISDRRTWQVGPDRGESTRAAGTLTLRYGPGSENFVRVYVGGTSGSKVATLSSQAGDAVVGLDYGTYELTYEYVYDDGQGTEPTVVRTVTSEIVLGEEVPIYVVINAMRENQTKQIPLLEEIELSAPQPYGTLRVTNATASPVTVWVGGELIEHVAYIGDGSAQNASTVPAAATVEYVVPAGTMIVGATSLSGVTLAERTVVIDPDGELGFQVGSAP